MQKVVTFDFKGRHFIYQELMSAEQSRNCSALLVHHLLISLPLLTLRANLQSSPEHCMNCCTENFELKVCFFVSFFNSNRIELWIRIESILGAEQELSDNSYVKNVFMMKGGTLEMMTFFVGFPSERTVVGVLLVTTHWADAPYAVYKDVLAWFTTMLVEVS